MTVNVMEFTVVDLAISTVTFLVIITFTVFTVFTTFTTFTAFTVFIAFLIGSLDFIITRSSKFVVIIITQIFGRVWKVG